MEELGPGILCAVWGGKQRCGWKSDVVEVREGMIDGVGWAEGDNRLQRVGK